MKLIKDWKVGNNLSLYKIHSNYSDKLPETNTENIIKQPNTRKEMTPEICLSAFFEVFQEDTFYLMHKKQ